MTTPDTAPESVCFPVAFYVRDDAALDELRVRARQLDDQNIGEHAVEYSPEQAITVVLHSDPTYLFDRLIGWTHEGGQIWDNAEMVPADEETP